MPTPINKGNFTYCSSCIFKIEDNVKYPCSKSHKAVKKSDNCTYRRYFKECNLYKKKEGN